MSRMLRPSATLRSALLTLTALWLAVVGSGVSMTHNHDDEPGATAPHRHLILFGVECPAETLEDCDGLGAWYAQVEPSVDPDAATDAMSFAALWSSTPELPAARSHVPTDWPAAPVGTSPSRRATRSAVLRA